MFDHTSLSHQQVQAIRCKQFGTDSTNPLVSSDRGLPAAAPGNAPLALATQTARR